MWVSTLKARSLASSKAMMPASSTKAECSQDGEISSVAARHVLAQETVDLGAPATAPVWARQVKSMRARKVLWTQCSDQVWASVSSSTSLGSRPALR